MLPLSAFTAAGRIGRVGLGSVLSDNKRMADQPRCLPGLPVILPFNVLFDAEHEGLAPASRNCEEVGTFSGSTSQETLSIPPFRKSQNWAKLPLLSGNFSEGILTGVNIDSLFTAYGVIMTDFVTVA